MSEWRVESREPPGRDLYLAETGGQFSDQGANSSHVLHGDDVAQDLHAPPRVWGAFVGGRPWLRTNPVDGGEQVPALEEAKATAEQNLMLPADTGAPAGYLAGAFESRTHAVDDVSIDPTWTLRLPMTRGWIGWV